VGVDVLDEELDGFDVGVLFGGMEGRERVGVCVGRELLGESWVKRVYFMGLTTV
jgi:hypothetical protein